MGNNQTYTRLYKFQEQYYAQGAPLIITNGALLKDGNQRVLAQIRFRNISYKEIIAVKISIKAFDSFGTSLDGIDEFQYSDIYIQHGVCYGDNVPIYLPNAATRKVNVQCTTVLFDDGSIWKNEKSVWKAVPFQEQLSLKGELLEEYRELTSKASCYEPKEFKDIWFCSCGDISYISDDACCGMCGVSKKTIFESLDQQLLEESYNKRTYEQAKTLVDSANNENSINSKEKLLTEALKKYEEVGDYKESSEKQKEIIKKLEELKALQLEQSDKNKKAIKRITVVASVIVTVFIIAFVIITEVIVPKARYTNEIKVLETASVGDVVQFGPYEWLVLRKEDSDLWLITENCVAKKPFNENGNTNWQESDLCQWLNNDFLRKFSANEQSMIYETEVNGTDNMVYLIDLDSADRYFSVATRKATFKGEECSWWLRPQYNEEKMAIVRMNGTIDYYGSYQDDNDVGVRPVIWIKTELDNNE